jgi:hypothetical protein
MSAEISQLAAHLELPEPELLFHPDLAQETEVHPLRGLLRFGPYSRSLLQSLSTQFASASWLHSAMPLSSTSYWKS